MCPTRINNSKVTSTRCTPAIARRHCRARLNGVPALQYLLSKHNRVAPSVRRIPLATKSAVINGAHMTAPSQCTVHLPRGLTRPASKEISMSSISTAYPELNGVQPEYIREKLALLAPSMIAGLSNIKANPPTSTLPKELEVTFKDSLSSITPTHMVAVHSPSSSSSPRKVTMFPVHHIVLASHCYNLPAFPAGYTSTSSTSSAALPVVPLCLPSAQSFPILLSYLYKKDTQTLSYNLLPQSTPMNASILMHRAVFVSGFWRNACALGVLDEELYEAVQNVWNTIMRGLERTRS